MRGRRSRQKRDIEPVSAAQSAGGVPVASPLVVFERDEMSSVGGSLPFDPDATTDGVLSDPHRFSDPSRRRGRCTRLNGHHRSATPDLHSMVNIYDPEWMEREYAPPSSVDTLTLGGC
jgi:hypothetical protein